MIIKQKILFITALLILSSVIAIAQTEICNDGIDNDGVGLLI
jgi:hypothetical protein